MTNTPINGPVTTPSVPWEILQGMHAVLAGDWTAATYEARFLGTACETSLVYTSRSGLKFRHHGGDPNIRALDQAVTHLRRAEHSAEYGPWFSVMVNLGSDGTLEMTRLYGELARWDQPIPDAAYTEELRLFPRDDAAIPGWLREKAGLEPTPATAGSAALASALDPAPAPAPAPADASGLRRAEVFDGIDEATGMPVVKRSRLQDDEAQRVLAYLRAAPVFLSARSFDSDAFFPENPPAVPLKSATDGTWIWTGAVIYYLEKYGMPPESDLLEHIREQSYVLPDVSEDTKEAARDIMTRRS